MTDPLGAPEPSVQPVILYDTTLRDGTQGENITLSLADKLRIARMLDEHIGNRLAAGRKSLDRNLDAKTGQIGGHIRAGRAPDSCRFPQLNFRSERVTIARRWRVHARSSLQR